MNSKGSRRKNQAQITNVFEQQQMMAKAGEIRNSLRSHTWHDLETAGKFDKNQKLSFISEDMLIVGCDIGSEMHYVRAIDIRGRELSKSAFSFSNTAEGFASAKDWALGLAAAHNKKQIVLGLEPTGHYWFALPIQKVISIKYSYYKCLRSQIATLKKLFSL
ncbi:MAG: IS110 family transposase [Lachnospiraceae bacterium]|nr:IS110 family transposase [Lachnospiraceae bacterium]